MDKMISVLVTPTVRHAMTAVAGAMVAIGLIAPAQQGAFAELATGIAIGAVGLIWSYVKNSMQHRK